MRNVRTIEVSILKPVIGESAVQNSGRREASKDLGMVRRKKRTRPTIPKTMLQVPWLVRVFMAMMNVKT